MSTVSSFSALLASFIPLRTAPTFENLKVIASGWVLSAGKRTVTAIIGRAGAVGTSGGAHRADGHGLLQFGGDLVRAVRP